jgi:hypothetical protein
MRRLASRPSLRARFLARLEKARGFGMMPLEIESLLGLASFSFPL